MSDKILRGPRKAALVAISLVLTAATAVALAESYRGLYDWASRHGLAGGWAIVWPLQIDTFILVGELSLFVALVDRWPARARVPAWAITIAGLAISVAGNVGHVRGSDVLVRATAAVPPLAAAVALAVGLGVVKRSVELHHRHATEVASDPRPDKARAEAVAASAAPARKPRKTRGLAAATRRAIAAADAGEPVPSARQLAKDHHIARDRAGRARAAALAAADGHGTQTSSRGGQMSTR